MTRFRVAVGGIEHEGTCFITEPTPLEAFYRRCYRGDEMASLGPANRIIDGLVRGVREQGMDMVPLVSMEAVAGGLATLESYVSLKEQLLGPLRTALPVDGVLLDLHGAFAAQSLDDGDGDILQSVRGLVGPHCPLMAVHDMHGNISRRMVEAADALIVERTYPHTDMAERGLEAAALMARVVADKVRPTMAYRALPLFWSAEKMISASAPMSEVVDMLTELDREPGVLTASIGTGYQWADGPHVGASVIVVTDNDATAAQSHADRLARWIWQRRAVWQRPPLSPLAALEMGAREGRYPIILADQADNTGGGAPGDSTDILRLFIDRRLEDAAVLYMVDPETAASAHAAGAGATIRVKVGGKSDPRLGPPVPMAAQVLAVSRGHFTYDGPMWAGVAEDLGPSALLRQRGVCVVVTSVRNQPVDLAFARSLGLDCRRMRYLSLKSTGHFRSGFGPIAGSIYNVDAGGLLTQDFSKLGHRRLQRAVYPMQASATIDW